MDDNLFASDDIVIYMDRNQKVSKNCEITVDGRDLQRLY